MILGKVPATQDYAVDLEQIPIRAWRAVQTRPCHEKTATQHLQSRGYEVFLPTHHTRRRRTDRYVTLEIALFPGYLFCRCERARLSSVLSIPGVVRILGTRGQPAVLADVEIARLATIAQASIDVQPWKFTPSGTLVRLQAGPLRGLDGIVIGCDDRKEKLLVSVTMLQRSAVVSIDPGWLPIELQTGVGFNRAAIDAGLNDTVTPPGSVISSPRPRNTLT